MFSFLKAWLQCLHETFYDSSSGGVVFPFPMPKDILLGITDGHIICLFFLKTCKQLEDPVPCPFSLLPVLWGLGQSSTNRRCP